jgi:tRNA (guanine37-N1)-methyltransferase
VLLSGDHAAIARWRRDCALRVTAANRPDLAARLAAGQDPVTGQGIAAGSAAQDGPAALDARDREVLFEAGFPVSGEDVAH